MDRLDRMAAGQRITIFCPSCGHKNHRTMLSGMLQPDQIQCRGKGCGKTIELESDEGDDKRSIPDFPDTDASERNVPSVRGKSPSLL